MDYTGYQLENAQRHLADLYREAENSALVEEFNEEKTSQKVIPWWHKLFGRKPAHQLNARSNHPVA